MALARFSAVSPEKQVPVLSVLLPLTRKLKSFDSRDKIFSMLGMVDKEDLHGITPDYTLDLAKVYTRCARAIIGQERGLSILSGTLGPLQDQTLPSWVPDWRLSRRMAYIHGFEWPNIRPFFHEINKGAPFDNKVSSSHHSDASGNEEAHSRHLSLRGARIDYVDSVHEPVALLKHLRKFNNATRHIGRRGKMRAHLKWTRALGRALDKLCVELGLLPPKNHNPGDDDQTRKKTSGNLLYTLCANRVTTSAVEQATGFCDPDRKPAGNPSAWATSLSAENEVWVDLCHEFRDLGNTAVMMVTFLRCRSVFRTREGLVGIGPDYLEKGDQVWDLMGGEVPFVLKPTDLENTTRPCYKLVGESYVHGIMNGELWKARTPEKQMRVGGEDLVFENINLV